MTDLVKHYRQLLGIAKGWAEKNLAGWCDDMHRDLISRHGAVPVGGRVSASSMNMPQLSAALEDYEKRGWPRTRQFSQAKSAQAKSVPPRIATLVKLWGKLGQAGKVNNSSRQALLAFCARQVAHNVPDLDSLTVAECQSITEALKAWFARQLMNAPDKIISNNQPAVDEDLLRNFPPVLRAVVKALGFVRAREFLDEHGGINQHIPLYHSRALGLSDDELAKLRVTLVDHLDAAGRIWLPKPDKLFMMVRNTQIRKDKKHTSINKLAKANKLSSRHILNICRETDEAQFDLF